MLLLDSLCILILAQCRETLAVPSHRSRLHQARRGAPRDVYSGFQVLGNASLDTANWSVAESGSNGELKFKILKAPDPDYLFVWHMHFHKAAGTTMGSLAFDNGLRLVPDDMHPKLGHLDLGIDSIVHRPVELIVRRLQQLRETGVQFGSTEHWFPPLEAFQEIRRRAPWVKFAVILRDPVNRTVSSYNFHQGKGHRCEPEPCTDIMSFADAESNLVTRMMNGLAFGPRVLGQVASQLHRQADSIRTVPTAVSRAREVLDEFDVVLIQEQLSHPKTKLMLRQKLGWTNVRIPHLNGGEYEPVNQSTAADIEKLNKLDKDIYMHFRTVFMDG